mmetsp:Transcript_2538/g.6046  ORF Transcript_2538/g.6046 Transcript_2538/m.6046 type:complete len:483 (-) Transcript_2538:712-2160(-)
MAPQLLPRDVLQLLLRERRRGLRPRAERQEPRAVRAVLAQRRQHAHSPVHSGLADHVGVGVGGTATNLKYLEHVLIFHRTPVVYCGSHEAPHGHDEGLQRLGDELGALHRLGGFRRRHGGGGSAAGGSNGIRLGVGILPILPSGFRPSLRRRLGLGGGGGGFLGGGGGNELFDTGQCWTNETSQRPVDGVGDTIEHRRQVLGLPQRNIAHWVARKGGENDAGSQRDRHVVASEQPAEGAQVPRAQQRHARVRVAQQCRRQRLRRHDAPSAARAAPIAHDLAKLSHSPSLARLHRRHCRLVERGRQRRVQYRRHARRNERFEPRVRRHVRVARRLVYYQYPERAHGVHEQPVAKRTREGRVRAPVLRCAGRTRRGEYSLQRRDAALPQQRPPPRAAHCHAPHRRTRLPTHSSHDAICPAHHLPERLFREVRQVLLLHRQLPHPVHELLLERDVTALQRRLGFAHKHLHALAAQRVRTLGLSQL